MMIQIEVRKRPRWISMVILIGVLLLEGVLAAVWIRFIWLAHKDTLGIDIITALVAILTVVLALLALIPIIFPGPVPVGSGIQRVDKLERADLKMGDDVAADFHYVVTPIKDAYDAAIKALHKASERRKSGKRGLLVLGEANVGKTRLIIEALDNALPRWFVINLSFKDKVEIPNKRNIVVLIDDLQQYASVVSRGTDMAPQQGSKNSKDLRELLSKVRQVSRRVVVVAACRNEDLERLQSEFSWLFDDLEVVELPRFRADPGDVEGSQVVKEFVQNGAMHVEDWDGTLGSLVLGLKKKREQYYNDLSHQAKMVLHAMKLLHEARINDHNETYILRACADVFYETLLQTGTKAWRDAKDLLKETQFVTVKVAKESAKVSLTIRKDTYFDQVITDYLMPNDSSQFEEDFMLLRNVLVDLNSASDLLNLGDAFYGLEQYERALAAYDLVLTIDNKNAYAYFRRGDTLGRLNRDEEVPGSIEIGIEIQREKLTTLVDKANQVKVKMQDQSNTLKAELIEEGIFWGVIFTMAGRYEEALKSYEVVLEFDPQNASVWTYKGRTLSILGREPEAQEAFKKAQEFAP